MVVRLVVAEDSFLMREGIATALGFDDDLDLVETCESFEELLASVEEHRPDVVLTDIRMPPTHSDEGIQAAMLIRTKYPETGVVVLSQYVEPAYALRLFEDGSEGRAYLLKERVGDVNELAAAVRTVADGGTVVDPKVVDALIAGRSAGSSVFDRLTERERDVLAQMAMGGSNKAVGEALYISPRSVEKHINAIFTKLDLTRSEETHRRVQAVLMYLGEEST
jgi:DNA-binding NarL/FixJ family response regulator